MPLRLLPLIKFEFLLNPMTYVSAFFLAYSDNAHCKLGQYINLQHEGILICIEGELVKEGLLSLLKY